MVASQQHLIALYALYRTAKVRSIRLFILVSLLLLTFYLLSQRGDLSIALFLLNVFLMSEIFYRYRISRLRPAQTVAQIEEHDAIAACTQPVLYALYSAHSAEELVTHLLSTNQARFLLERAQLQPSELPHSTTDAGTLLRFAYKLTKNVEGTYITTADVLAAYVLLTDEQTHILLTKKLRHEDFMEILKWTRWKFSFEEHPKKLEIQSTGTGVGDNLVTGWTVETKKYTRDFSLDSLQKNNSIIGRVKEYELIQETLAKNQNNNVLLIGEQGAGKEGLIRKFAIDSYSGKSIMHTKHKKILEILVGPLIAGASNRGDLEIRLQAIIEEVSHAGNIILYIPEVQDILGSSSFSMDLSGALYPYLQSGNLPVIASVTQGNFKTYLEGKPLAQLFTPIALIEPKEEQTKRMLMEVTTDIERAERVAITYNGLLAAVQYGNRYISDMQLPGSAVRLLQDTVVKVTQLPTTEMSHTNKRIISSEAVIKTVEERTHITLSEPNAEEKNRLLHLEDTLHEHIIGQNEAITVLAQALRRLRSGMMQQDRPTSFLFLGPTGVGKTETAKTLAQIYFGGKKSMIRLDMSEYSDATGEKRLLGAPPGEGEERGELTEKVRDNPYSLILLDEFEKAHPRILDLFLQVFEDGRLTDNKGRTVSFVNSIIIATSNAGSSYISEEVRAGRTLDSKKLMEFLQTQHLLKPELLNRFDDVVIFRPLIQEEIQQIAKLLLIDLHNQMKEKDIHLSYDEEVVLKISSEGFDQQYGARPIRRFIQDTIEDLLSRKMLSDEIKRGSTVVVKVINNEFAVNVS